MGAGRRNRAAPLPIFAQPGGAGMSRSRRIRRASGELLFAALFFALALFLLSRLSDQTRWVKGVMLFAQPAFWPGVGLAGMVLFGGFHLRACWRRDDLRRERGEALVWLRSVEYALWFMGYVWAVPRIGYLPASVVFAPLLAFRVGYRRPVALWSAAALGLGTVLFFKSLLGVKIPGGAVYEYLPDGLRALFQAAYIASTQSLVLYPGLSGLVVSERAHTSMEVARQLVTMPTSRALLYHLLSKVDIFTLWRLFLLGLAVSAVARFSRRKSYALVVGVWLLFVVLSAIPTLVSMLLMGSAVMAGP